LKLEVKKKFIARSVRVKSVDIHPNYPWVLAALYSGNANIYDYNTQVPSFINFQIENVNTDNSEII
jgi:hypothetical protein